MHPSYVESTHKKHFGEVHLISTYSIHFCKEKRKISGFSLSGAMLTTSGSEGGYQYVHTAKTDELHIHASGLLTI